MALILVVDDEAMVLLAVRRGLEQAGHHILEARDGHEALNLCTSLCPDLIVCDIFMPRKDGLETIREIRRRGLCERIIAISGGSGIVPLNYVELAKAMGASLLFAKPLKLPEIVKAVERLLSEPTHVQQHGT